MNTGAKKYSGPEIQMLRMHNQRHQGTQFTEEDFKELAAGTARFKAQSRADKILGKIQRRMNLPISRLECHQAFLTIKAFNDKHGQLNNELLFLAELLIKKGIFSQEELTLQAHETTAKHWRNLCDGCRNILSPCEAKRKYAKDVYPDLTGDLADKVIECDKFEEMTEDVKTENVQKTEVAEGKPQSYGTEEVY